MKVVINDCYGGFSLSPRALQRYAELKGRPCYFFKKDIAKGLHSSFIPISIEEATRGMFWSAFDVPNPNETLPSEENWHELTMEQRTANGAAWRAHSIESRPDDRADPDLIRVVEELGSGHGEGASGRCASLKIVEIPDGTDYVIEEYDGNEHVAEAHRTWS